MQQLPSLGSDGGFADDRDECGDGGDASPPVALTDPQTVEGADPETVAESDTAGIGPTIAETIVQWREHGLAKQDPVRFRFIEALARRAAGCSGDARRVLDARLLQALESYRSKGAAKAKMAAEPADASANAATNAFTDASTDAPPNASAIATATPDSLAALLRELATDKPSAGELKAVGNFRSTWTRMGVEQRLRQSRAKVPGNAGPLNSHALILRSLTLMRELSPEYLTRFIGHVDALLWLEQANGGQSVLQNDVLGAEPEKPAKKTASRRRQAPPAPKAE